MKNKCDAKSCVEATMNQTKQDPKDERFTDDAFLSHKHLH